MDGMAAGRTLRGGAFAWCRIRSESVVIAGPRGCPFCPGAENKTPPEILAYGRNGGGANTSGWSIRVVPNRFPALGIEGELDREGEGLFAKMNGVGAHE